MPFNSDIIFLSRKNISQNDSIISKAKVRYLMIFDGVPHGFPFRFSLQWILQKELRQRSPGVGSTPTSLQLRRFDQPGSRLGIWMARWFHGDFHGDWIGFNHIQPTKRWCYLGKFVTLSHGTSPSSISKSSIFVGQFSMLRTQWTGKSLSVRSPVQSIYVRTYYDSHEVLCSSYW